MPRLLTLSSRLDAEDAEARPRKKKTPGSAGADLPDGSGEPRARGYSANGHGVGVFSFKFEHRMHETYRWEKTAWRNFRPAPDDLLWARVWNGTDSFLKERVFGLPGNPGNHGRGM